MDQAQVTVNGERRVLGDVPAHVNALDWLRDQGLTGSKEGCAEGECGACSVMVARPGIDTPTEWTALNSCLVPAVALAGQEVVTSEGLGTSSQLHPVQHELAVRGGSQCGYCTPGFVCSMAAEYYRPSRNGDFDLHAISGNLCRCTGYRPIKDAALALGAPAADDPLSARVAQDPPGRAGELAQVLEAVAAGAVPVAGSTDLGVDINLKAARPSSVVLLDRVAELSVFEVGETVRLGAGLSLTEIERRLDGRIPLFDELFPLFASRLIRNGATLGGNLATASPIGDTPPVLLALDATLVLASAAGTREVALVDFFTGYRETALAPGELITEVRFPMPTASVQAFHKIAKRRLDDISSVAVAYALDVTDGVVRRARIGLGGVAATPIRALATEDALTGQAWAEESVERAAEVLQGEGTPMDDHRASAAYRAAMLGQSLRKLWVVSRASSVGHLNQPGGSDG